MNFRIPILFIIVIAGFSACKEKDTVPPSDKNPPEVITVNTTNDTVNIYQNGIRQNNTSSIYPGGATGYMPFLRGTQNFQIRRTGTTDVLFTKSVAIDSATNYTFFVAGTTADKFFTTTDNIHAAYDTVATDDTTFTTSVIRFVNASYDSGSVNVTLGAANTVNIQSLAFGKATSFMKFTVSGTQHVKIYLANTTTAKIDTPIAFQPGLIYTLYTKGSPTGTGSSAFSIGLTINQYIPLKL